MVVSAAASPALLLAFHRCACQASTDSGALMRLMLWHDLQGSGRVCVMGDVDPAGLLCMAQAA
jgi:hypothetical protein